MSTNKDNKLTETDVEQILQEVTKCFVKRISECELRALEGLLQDRNVKEHIRHIEQLVREIAPDLLPSNASPISTLVAAATIGVIASEIAVRKACYELGELDEDCKAILSQREAKLNKTILLVGNAIFGGLSGLAVGYIIGLNLGGPLTYVTGDSAIDEEELKAVVLLMLGTAIYAFMLLASLWDEHNKLRRIIDRINEKGDVTLADTYIFAHSAYASIAYYSAALVVGTLGYLLGLSLAVKYAIVAPAIAFHTKVKADEELASQIEKLVPQELLDKIHKLLKQYADQKAEQVFDAMLEHPVTWLPVGLFWVLVGLGIYLLWRDVRKLYKAAKTKSFRDIKQLILKVIASKGRALEEIEKNLAQIAADKELREAVRQSIPKEIHRFIHQLAQKGL